mmetsp:Transcript_3320/g.4917  ORF Transcript_3320/g.4917 Transcript_3320/m.4917 type:complete len:876 (-) Transcript_3320:161-2788(-)
MKISSQQLILAGLTVLAVAASSETVRYRKLETQRSKLDHAAIPKYVESLTIPSVLYDASVDNSIEIAVRQITQQVLPSGYPITTLWAYGNPLEPSTFSNPAGTVEAIKDHSLLVTWTNDLVQDPDTCLQDPQSDACNYLIHILQDKEGAPIVDQTLHWANPGRSMCEDGSNRTDCRGTSVDAYWGPIPTTMHVHGGHSIPQSDGYPEGWFLPNANDIPEGYVTHGAYYANFETPLTQTMRNALATTAVPATPNVIDTVANVPSTPNTATIAPVSPIGSNNGATDDGIITFIPVLPTVSNSSATDDSSDDSSDDDGATDDSSDDDATDDDTIVYTSPPIGKVVCDYSNDGPQATLFYHDHTVGITRLNVYAAAGGFWLVRGEDELADLYEYDCLGKKQVLPGPSPKYGEDPNGDYEVRRKIREIPLMIQGVSFYDDGSLFYPANRAFFDGKGEGDGFAETTGFDSSFPFKPNAESDVSPIWNPEAFFDTWVVNGKTWPKLEVAPERYRFRILNLADSTTLNLVMKVVDTDEEIPFYIIGGDQGYLPYVVKIRTGYYTQLTTPGGDNTEEQQISSAQALLLMPGERYDLIIDFTGMKNGTEILMLNTAPNEPFGGLEDYTAADFATTGQVLKFILNDDLSNPDGDQSTLPSCLRLDPNAVLPEVTGSRTVKLVELESELCVIDDESYGVKNVECVSGVDNHLGPAMATLGYGNDQTDGNMWSDPIEMNPSLNSTEIVEVWNWTEDAHPIHFHLVHFLILGRYDINNPDSELSSALPWEQGFKDVAIAYPGQITKIKMHFDRPGLYVWHCHILSHEDNEMMLKFCVGDKSIDCPPELSFSVKERQLSIEKFSDILVETSTAGVLGKNTQLLRGSKRVF